MTLHIVRGNVLDHPGGYIAHQCNTTTWGRPAGLAGQIWDKYPATRYLYNTYTTDRVLGTVVKTGNILNMFAQYHPGRNRIGERRLEWFQQCLDTPIMKTATDIAFPWGIGCGLAGGVWDLYINLILQYSQSRLVKIYKLP